MDKIAVAFTRIHGRISLNVGWRGGIINDADDYKTALSIAINKYGGNEAEAHRHGKDISVQYEFWPVSIQVDFVPVYTTPDTPYLDLSRYNIWVVPEYIENVDVFSNMTWVVI